MNQKHEKVRKTRFNQTIMHASLNVSSVPDFFSTGLYLLFSLFLFDNLSKINFKYPFSVWVYYKGSSCCPVCVCCTERVDNTVDVTHSSLIIMRGAFVALDFWPFIQKQTTFVTPFYLPVYFEKQFCSCEPYPSLKMTSISTQKL